MVFAGNRCACLPVDAAVHPLSDRCACSFAPHRPRRGDERGAAKPASRRYTHMMGRLLSFPLAVAATILASAPAPAQPSARAILTDAAFTATTKDEALGQVGQALASAQGVLARSPRDEEALLQRAIAIGYRAKLRKSLPDAKEARRQMEALVAMNPKNAEATAALAGWHMDGVAQLGGFMARTMLGASRQTGLALLDRALQLGGNHALFPGMAALTRIQTDQKDVAAARALADRATSAGVANPLDRYLQRASAALLQPLKAGDGRAAQALAGKLLPFGRIAG